jgi:tRNA threonylcarbamoyladenosine biosynthesis protein TsaE
VNGDRSPPGWTLTEEELVSWGHRIGLEAEVPLVIALRGDLGAGKTTLARAIARGAGVAGHLPSPTYNLLFQYRGRGRTQVVHIDLYRLRVPDEVWELGWSELPGEDDIVLIEWPERVEELLPTPRWDVRLSEAGTPTLRHVFVQPAGDPPFLPLPAEGALSGS